MGTKIKSQLEISLEKEAFLKRFIRENVIKSRFINTGRNVKLAKCIGFLGPRGSTKSLSGSAMTNVDYLIPGYDVWSNMQIKFGMRIGDYLVGYATKDIDKAEMLKLNVGHGMLFIDEINLEFSEARRAMTNRNLTFNKLIQQLRKKQLNLIYTVQHEMWVDDRLRFQTDIFIKCQDILLKPGGLRYHMDFGTIAEWTIYDMSGILGAGSYYETLKPVKTVRFMAKYWWNTFDTWQSQGEDEETYGKLKPGEFETIGSNAVLEASTQWGWLYDKVQTLHDQGIEEIEDIDLWAYLGIAEDNQLGLRILVGRQLRKMGIRPEPISPYNKVYIIPETDLTKPETMRKRGILVS